MALSTINAASKCNKKIIIKFPQFLGRISTMNKNKKNKINYEDVKFFEEQQKPTIFKVTNKVKETKSRGRPKKEK